MSERESVFEVCVKERERARARERERVCKTVCLYARDSARARQTHAMLVSVFPIVRVFPIK